MTNPNARLADTLKALRAGAPKRRVLRELWRALRGEGSRARMALSVGFGLFIGSLPLYGLHLPLCLLVCLPFKLDAVVAYLAANISNPFVAPFLIFTEVEVGSYVLKGVPIAFDVASARRTGIAGFVGEAALGSILVGGALGGLGGALTALFAGRPRQESAFASARRRTRARYRGVPPADRYYVAAKLASDPVLGDMQSLGPLGDVIDAGCGRGQLGLYLLELGQLKTLSGFDFDARKVEVAKLAARGDAGFCVADLARAEFTPADTILLIDVLHYLELAEQASVLARAARSLRESGRLVIRDVDAAAARGSFLTRGFERVATGIGYNRAQGKLRFRVFSELVLELEGLGLECTFVAPRADRRLANRMLVARRPETRARGASS